MNHYRTGGNHYLSSSYFGMLCCHSCILFDAKYILEAKVSHRICFKCKRILKEIVCEPNFVDSWVHKFPLCKWLHLFLVRKRGKSPKRLHEFRWNCSKGCATAACNLCILICLLILLHFQIDRAICYLHEPISVPKFLFEACQLYVNALYHHEGSIKNCVLNYGAKKSKSHSPKLKVGQMA